MRLRTTMTETSRLIKDKSNLYVIFVELFLSETLSLILHQMHLASLDELQWNTAYLVSPAGYKA